MADLKTGRYCMLLRVRWLKLFTRVLLSMGGTYGLFQGLLHHSVVVGVEQGISFGTAMAILATGLTAWKDRGRAGSLSPRQTRHIAIPYAVDEAADSVAAALRALPAKITTATKDVITAKTATTWRGWGEVVTVELKPESAVTIATIASRPRLRTTVVDYGRGQELVDALAQTLAR